MCKVGSSVVRISNDNGYIQIKPIVRGGAAGAGRHHGCRRAMEYLLPFYVCFGTSVLVKDACDERH